MTQINKKRTYEKPSIKVYELQHPVSLLTVSNTDGPFDWGNPIDDR